MKEEILMTAMNSISMLTDEERIQVTTALQHWANQALQDELVIEFAGRDRFLTPFQMYVEVEQNTPDGQAILRILQNGVRQDGLEQVVNRLADKGS